MGKGARREQQAVELYKQAGWATYKPETARYGENDIWGLFDLLAVSPYNDHAHAVQVKSNVARGIRKFTRSAWLFRQAGLKCYYLVCYDREGWRLIESAETSAGMPEAVTKVDEREQDCKMGEAVTAYLSQAQSHV